MSRLRSVLVLVAFLAISYAVAALGTIATISNVDGWYASADKASWSPPNGLFGPVWTVLYGLMSVAAWLVWRTGAQRGAQSPTRPRPPGALTLYVVQLVLNALWTPVFFGLYPAIGVPALWIALAIIVALDVLVLLTMIAFWRRSRPAGWMLAPYWMWLLFATSLNVAIAIGQA